MTTQAVPESQGPLFHPPPLRRDVSRFQVQEHVWLQAYWKVLGEGKGPAAILYLFGIETLKFDLFGAGKGHYHVNPNNPDSARAHALRLPEPNAGAQVTRTVFELEHNVDYYLQRNVDERIRHLVLDRARWREALDWLDSTLRRHLETVPELEGL